MYNKKTHYKYNINAQNNDNVKSIIYTPISKYIWSNFRNLRNKEKTNPDIFQIPMYWCIPNNCRTIDLKLKALINILHENKFFMHSTYNIT